MLAALLATAWGTQAAGLGKLTVYSAIGQPLNAEVALTATAEELAAMSAKLGSHEAFREAGIDFMPALSGLRFSVVKTPGNQAVLKLTTERPLNEPFLHFLVELNWPSGRMTREYTFLLDPPEMLQAAKPATVVSPVSPVARPAVQPLPVSDAVVGTKSAPPITVAGEGQVQVRSGDTLSKIARESKVESINLDQMLVALFNINRDAFIDNNMNRLRAGKILRMPDADEVRKIDAGEARKVVISQAADFNAYRRRLAEAADKAPAVEAPPQQKSTGKIKPQVDEKAPPVPAGVDKLEVSRTEADKSSKAAVKKGNLEEDLIARDKALREAAGRIADLEKNLENLKHLVELKSQAGTQVQQQAQATLPKPAEAKKAEPPELKKPETAPAPVPAKPAEPEKAPEPATAKPEESAKPAASPTAEKPIEVTAAKPAEATAIKPAADAPSKAKKPAAAPPPPPPEPDFIEENPSLVFGGGALLALLLGYFGYATWRKKKQIGADQLTNEPSVSASDLASKSGAIFGAASESVNSGGDVSIQGDFSDGGILTTEESVDPVAEADVYMAYGRDGQAEDILLAGLKSDPTRPAIHLKLLELYANRKSVEPFENVARELHALNGGKGQDWDKAARLAVGLGINGGLFAEAAASQDESAPSAQEEPPAESSQTLVMQASDLQGVVAPVAEEEAGSLDFDLDLGTTSVPAAAAAAKKDDGKPASEEAMSLDFDFDLGSTSEQSSAPAADIPVEAEPAPAAADDIDFSLDIGSTPQVEAEAPDVATSEVDIDFDLEVAAPAPAEPEAAAGENTEAATPAELGGDLNIDFDLELDSSAGSQVPAASEPPQAEAEPESADISFDVEEAGVQAEPIASGQKEAAVDFDVALDTENIVSPVGETQVPGQSDSLPQLEEAAAELKPEPLVELPDIDLESDQDMQPVSLVPPEPESIPDDPEVATKLELAQAYEEMGDREGARELLGEVVNEGSPAQQAQARARLDQLGV